LALGQTGVRHKITSVQHHLANVVLPLVVVLLLVIALLVLLVILLVVLVIVLVLLVLLLVLLVIVLVVLSPIHVFNMNNNIPATIFIINESVMLFIQRVDIHQPPATQLTYLEQHVVSKAVEKSLAYTGKRVIAHQTFPFLSNSFT